MSKSTNCKPRIIFVGALPPPVYGAALVFNTLVTSNFKNVFDLYIVNTQFNKNTKDIEKFKLTKLFLLFKHYIRYVYLSIMKNPDFLILAISYRWTAFLKEMIYIFLARLINIKIILYGQGEGFYSLFYKKCNFLQQKLIDKSFFYIDGIVVPSVSIQNDFNYWCNNKHIAVIHNCLPFRASECKEIKKNYKSENRKISVLFLSLRMKAKGYWTVLRAANLINKRRKDIQFNFFGGWWEKEANEKSEVEYFIHKHELDDIIFLGDQVNGENKEQIFLQADIFVFPTERESFGIVNLEAMYYGLPIITTRHGAIPEYIKDGVNGFLIPDRDAESLAEKIEYLADHYEWREKIGKENSMLIRERYTIERFEEEWIRFVQTFDLKSK